MPKWPRRRRAELRAEGDLLAVGRAAYADHDWDVEVVDLMFDSVVDTPLGVSDDVRHLRFVGRDCTVDVDVNRQRRLAVRVWPGGRVVVELRTPGDRGGGMTVEPRGQTLTWRRPQLASFVLRWPESDRRAARTAWVLL